MLLKKAHLGYLSKKIKQNRPVICHSIRMSKSTKSRQCVYCGTEIPKGDFYYSYKPVFGKRKDRCLDHKPAIYNDYEEYDV